MNFLRKNWQFVSFVIVIFVVVMALGIGYTIRSQAAEKKIETATFFTIPVYVLLPNNNYVKQYDVQTNELVSIRNMLAYNDIAMFSDEKVTRINEYNEDQKLLQSFSATAETPFYVRVIAKDNKTLSYYQELQEPTTTLSESYLVKEGIEIIIEQPYYSEQTESNTFLTDTEIQASLEAKTIRFTSVNGYYDEYGNWIEEIPEVDIEWENDPEVLVCQPNQIMIDGSCQEEQPSVDDEYIAEDVKPEINVDTSQPVIPPTPNPPQPTICTESEQLVNGVCQPKPTVPICSADEILVDGVCQPKPIQPVCTDDEELIDGVCQPKPLPEVPDDMEQVVIVSRKE